MERRRGDDREWRGGEGMTENGEELRGWQTIKRRRGDDREWRGGEGPLFRPITDHACPQSQIHLVRQSPLFIIFRPFLLDSKFFAIIS